MRREKDIQEVQFDAMQEIEEFIAPDLVEQNHQYTDEEALEEFGDPYDV